MTIKNQFNKLLRLLSSRKTVERLFKSNDPYQLYENEKLELIDQVNALKEKANQELDSKVHIFCKDEIKIIPSNSLDICIIFIMTGIDDYSYFYDWLKVADALEEVKGEMEPLAKKIVDLIDKRVDLFSLFSEKELIKKIFL